MQNTEQRAAKTILERGVQFTIPVPVWMRLFLWRKKLVITIRQPYLGTLFRISELYLGMGIKDGALENLKMQDALEVFKKNGETVSLIAATAAINKRLSILIRPLAWMIRSRMTSAELFQLVYTIITFSGVHDFINTIRLIQAMKITEPRNNLSQTGQGS